MVLVQSLLGNPLEYLHGVQYCPLGTQPPPEAQTVDVQTVVPVLRIPFWFSINSIVET